MFLFIICVCVLQTKVVRFFAESHTSSFSLSHYKGRGELKELEFERIQLEVAATAKNALHYRRSMTTAAAVGTYIPPEKNLH
jgi:hypothetical protein